MESEEELSPVEQLVRVNAKTHDDGTVDVTIEDWEKKDNYVEVSYSTPTYDYKSDMMAWPEPGPSLEENRFYRLLQSCGLKMRDAELLKGETVRASIHDKGGWQLVSPEPTPSMKEQAGAKMEEFSRYINISNIAILSFAALMFALTIATIVVIL